MTDKEPKRIGRPLRRVYTATRVADLIRNHLRDRGMSIDPHLARCWGVAPSSAHRRLYHGAPPITPGMVEAFVEFVALDDERAHEFRLMAAREFGFKV